jgi:hypothetical protein
MITNNRLDKSFGPAGSSAGLVLFAAGLISAWFYPLTLILVLVGAFMGFTFSGTQVDDVKKRVRFSNNLFGIIHTGRWLNIEPGMKVGLKKSDVTWRAYSMGNRNTEVSDRDFRIILFDAGNREIMPLKKTRTPDEAKDELEKLSARLGLPIQRFQIKIL